MVVATVVVLVALRTSLCGFNIWTNFCLFVCSGLWRSGPDFLTKPLTSDVRALAIVFDMMFGQPKHAFQLSARPHKGHNHLNNTYPYCTV